MSLWRKTYCSDVLRIALGSLLQHRLRSLLSIIGIICGVSAVFAIISIGEGARREVLAGINRLGLDNVILRRVDLPLQAGFGADSRARGLARDDVNLLAAASPLISGVSYLKELRVEVMGTGPRVRPQVVACSASYLSIHGLTLRRGRFLLPWDEKRRNMVCVLGQTVARELGSQGRVGAKLRVGNQLFVVVGIVQGAPPVRLKSSGTVLGREVNEMVFLPFGSQQYLELPGEKQNPGSLDELTIQFAGRDSVEALLPLIRRTMDIAHHKTVDYQLVVPRQLMRQAKKTQHIFNLVLGSIGGISLLVGGIGIMNVLLATISERTREIGIRRAVGASQQDIVAQFLAESVLLTAAGGVLGIVIGFGCSWAIARFADWSVAITLYGIAVPLLTSVAVGLAAGIYPALKASRMDPVRALRST